MLLYMSIAELALTERGGRRLITPPDATPGSVGRARAPDADRESSMLRLEVTPCELVRDGLLVGL